MRDSQDSDQSYLIPDGGCRNTPSLSLHRTSSLSTMGSGTILSAADFVDTERFQLNQHKTSLSHHSPLTRIALTTTHSAGWTKGKRINKVITLVLLRFSTTHRGVGGFERRADSFIAEDEHRWRDMFS